MSSDTTGKPFDALEACLRAVLSWHEQPLSSASLRSRVGSDEIWSQEILLEAADSLGYDVLEGQIDPALPALPALPAICVYSCEYKLRIVLPSNLVELVNTTVFVGILTPIEKVSVAKSNLIYPLA